MYVNQCSSYDVKKKRKYDIKANLIEYKNINLLQLLYLSDG